MNLRFQNNSYSLDNSDSLKHGELVSKAIETIEKFNMIKHEDSVMVSVSGGPDSVFLAYFFYLIKSKYKLKLYAFHLDHLTRNGDSGKDADFVKNFCSDLGIELFSERIDVQKWCSDMKMNFQEGARILRRNLLEKYRQKNQIKKVAIAHNCDDNLETFFMNLFRGSGLRGLGGIKPLSNNIIRPLISCSKKEIMYFLDSNKIRYRIDKTNFEAKYFRNRIRNILIPELESEFGISFKDNILNTIEVLRTISCYIDNETIKVISKIVKKQGISIKDVYTRGFIKIPVSSVENLDSGIKSALVFKLIELINGDAKDIISANINDILKFCYYGGENKRIDLPGKITFIKEKEYIYIFDSSRVGFQEIFEKSCRNLKPNKGYEVIGKNDISDLLKTKPLSKKKMTINKAGIKLEADILDIAGIDRNALKNLNSNEVCMDLDSIRFPVILRSWKNGDKFYPFGMNKEKKLQDFFIDAKVPFHLRESVPIFCDSEKIIWIGNFRIDDRIKVTGKTKTILYLKIAKN